MPTTATKDELGELCWLMRVQKDRINAILGMGTGIVHELGAAHAKDRTLVQTAREHDREHRAVRDDYLAGATPTEQFHAAKASLEQSIAAVKQYQESLREIQKNMTGSEDALAKAREEFTLVYSNLQRVAIERFKQTWNKDSLWRFGRMAELEWRARYFKGILGKCHDADPVFLQALQTFLSGKPFSCHVVRGFTNGPFIGGPHFLKGQRVEVPSQLPFDRGFEEILDGRLIIVE